jgi:2-polyprenyl-3-methyl-5-hydroxy-6-metoxy-1,4-benzoquinol methylase
VVLSNINTLGKTNTLDKNINEFDNKAKTWDTQPDRAHRAQVIADAIGKEIPFDPAFTAMEYGCGTGLLSFPLKDRFSNITMIDSSTGMIEVLKEKIRRTGAKNMDVLNVDLMDSNVRISRTFSVIFTSMVLHHIGDIGTIFKIWHTLLDRSGYLAIADLDLENGLFHGPEFLGHNGFDREDLKKIALESGFFNVRFKTVFEIKKVARDGAEHSFPLFLMVAEKPKFT